MTGMEDSDRSAVSRAFRSAADIRKATTKCHAPRHILYFQNESTHFTHPPFTDNVERYLIENVISTTPPSRPLPVVQIKTWRSAVGNCSRQRNEYHVWRKRAWNRIKNKQKKKSRLFVVTCSEETSTPTCEGDYSCYGHIFSKHLFHKT